MKEKIKHILTSNVAVVIYFLITLLLSLLFPVFKTDPTLKQIKENQQTLLKLNQEITANSTEWQLLEEKQKALSQTNSTLRKQRDELESAIATQMGLGIGGQASPTTTLTMS